MTSEGELRGEFFRAFKTRLRKCLEPTLTCENDPIRAHSIQNAQVIEAIAEAGHVIAPQLVVGEEGPKMELKSIGRNNASTFPGLCGEHDRVLFRPIDTRPFDLTNAEHLFLLAYRSVTRELHAAMESGAKLQGEYSRHVSQGRDDGRSPTVAAMLATGQLFNVWELWKYRAAFFDGPMIAQNWTALSHQVLILKGQAPVIAVSSLFSLAKLRRENDELVRCVLNIMPIAPDKTIAVFTFSPPDAAICLRALDRVLRAQGEYQKYELSKLVLERCENFILAPAHFNAWSASKVKTIQAAFNSNVMTEEEIADHHDLMLF